MLQDSFSPSRKVRLDGILDYLLAAGTASAQEVAGEFEISIMTAHRDLDALQARGAVRKFHGGVSVVRTGSYEIAATLRRRVAVDQKEALAAAAAATVMPGETILIDDSTTVAAMIPHLADVDELTVVTQYLPAIVALTPLPNVTVIALGGEYDSPHESFLGVGTQAALQRLRVDTAFVSTTTLDRAGVYHPEERTVALKELMLRAARRRVMLADGSKIGNSSLHRICGWDLVDELITTREAPAGEVGLIRDQGVNVSTVVTGSGS